MGIQCDEGERLDDSLVFAGAARWSMRVTVTIAVVSRHEDEGRKPPVMLRQYFNPIEPNMRQMASEHTDMRMPSRLGN
jgi:hypothetical protein